LGDRLLNHGATVDPDGHDPPSVYGHESAEIPLHLGRTGGPQGILMLLLFHGRHGSNRRRAIGLVHVHLFFANRQVHRLLPIAVDYAVNSELTYLIACPA
jgi:hypothetical protein